MERGFGRGLAGQDPSGYYQPVPQDCGLLEGGKDQDAPEGQKPASTLRFECQPSISQQVMETVTTLSEGAQSRSRGSVRPAPERDRKKNRLLYCKSRDALQKRTSSREITEQPFRERFEKELNHIREQFRDGLDELVDCLTMLYAMIFTNLLQLIITVMSYGFCVGLGVVHKSFVDASFFKATGLLLAVLLSLRAKMAMSRRQKLMNGILSMMNSAKNILELAGNEIPYKRRRLRLMLSFCFNEIAAWVMMDDNSGEGWLDVLPQEDRDMAFVLRGKYRLSTSPRALLVYLRQFVDELFDPDVERLRSCAKTTDLMEGIATNSSIIESVRERREDPMLPYAAGPGTAAGHSLSSAEAAPSTSAVVSNEGEAPTSSTADLSPPALSEASSPDGQTGPHEPDSKSQPKVNFQEECMEVVSADRGIPRDIPFSASKIDRVSTIRRFHRNVDLDLRNICHKFDELLMYKEELHTTQFRWMLSSVILLYVALYPWCVNHESTIVLGGTTIGTAFPSKIVICGNGG